MSVEQDRSTTAVPPRQRTASRPLKLLNTAPVRQRGSHNNQPFPRVNQPFPRVPDPGTGAPPHRWTARVVLPADRTDDTVPGAARPVGPTPGAARPVGPTPGAARPVGPTPGAAKQDATKPGTGTRSGDPGREGAAAWITQRSGALDQPRARRSRPAAPAAVVDLVVPVRDTAGHLPAQVAALHTWLAASSPVPWQLTIVDAASTDGTWATAARLTRDYRSVTAWRLPGRGRGTAVREAWLASSAEVVACLDTDRVGDPAALAPLLAALRSGDCDIAVGSRTAPAPAHPGPAPEASVFDRRRLVRLALHAQLHCAGCAVMVARAEAIRPLLGLVTSDGGFFGTELVLAAAHNGLRVRAVPVTGLGRTVPGGSGGTVTGLARVGWALVRGRLRVTGGRQAQRPGTHRARDTAPGDVDSTAL